MNRVSHNPEHFAKVLLRICDGGRGPDGHHRMVDLGKKTSKNAYGVGACDALKEMDLIKDVAI